jgi:phosphoenolpyruvate synthase/pyruvate phosphate dikinase
VLNAEGYKISPKQELIGTKERERIKSFLSAQIQNTDSSEVLCTGTSDGKGIYVAGNITLSRTNVGPDNILLVPFTTPADLKAIESVKAVIRTGGGTLSHAAITTRELKKPSVVLNGASWNDGSVEVTYYT